MAPAMTFVRPVIAFATAVALIVVGLWWVVSIGCLFGLLVWLRDSGPDDPPEPVRPAPVSPVSQLRRRQLDDVVSRDRRHG